MDPFQHPRSTTSPQAARPARNPRTISGWPHRTVSRASQSPAAAARLLLAWAVGTLAGAIVGIDEDNPLLRTMRHIAQPRLIAVWNEVTSRPWMSRCSATRVRAGARTWLATWLLPWSGAGIPWRWCPRGPG